MYVWQLLIDVGFAIPFMADSASPLIGEAVITGPDTGKFYSVWYGLKRTPGAPFTDQVVFIGVSSGEFTNVGAGRAVVENTLAIYAPSADADGDGFPDLGATPLLVLPVTTIDTRLPAPR
jgi:hypothetical protein